MRTRARDEATALAERILAEHGVVMPGWHAERAAVEPEAPENEPGAPEPAPRVGHTSQGPIPCVGCEGSGTLPGGYRPCPVCRSGEYDL